MDERVEVEAQDLSGLSKRREWLVRSVSLLLVRFGSESKLDADIADEFRRLQAAEERVRELEGALEPFFDGEDGYAGSLAEKVEDLVRSASDELSCRIIHQRFEAARKALREGEG